MDYEVDITKPPIPAPGRAFKWRFLGQGKETQESYEKSEAWERYIEQYDHALAAQRRKETQ